MGVVVQNSPPAVSGGWPDPGGLLPAFVGGWARFLRPREAHRDACVVRVDLKPRQNPRYTYGYFCGGSGYAHTLKQLQLRLDKGRMPLLPSPGRAIQDQGLLGIEREQRALA